MHTTTTRSFGLSPLLVLLVLAALAAGLTMSVVLARPAQAATLTVNSLADTTANDGQCTLREAITSANTDTASGAAAGECAAGSGDHTIDLTGVTGTINLTGGFPAIAT